jgi:hypothetical protein
LIEEQGAQVVGVATVIDFGNSVNFVAPTNSVAREALFSLEDFGLAPLREVPAREPLAVFPDLNVGDYTAPQSTSLLDSRGIVAASDRGFVTAIDFTGAEIWRFQSGDTEKGVRCVLEAFEDSVIFGSYDGRIYRLRRSNGAVIWSNHIGAFVGASFAIDARSGVGFVAVNHEQKRSDFLAVDLADGSVLWRVPANAWSYARPALGDDEKVAFAANNGQVMMLNREDGGVCWSTNVGAPVKGWLATADGTCCFGTFDGFFCALSNSDGQVRWRRRLAAWLLVHPLIIGNVALASGRNHLVAFNLDDGAPKWVRPTGRVTGAGVSPDRSCLVGGNDNGDVFCLDLERLEYRWRYRAGGAFRATPVVSDNLAVLPCYDGNLYTFALN